jgi:hypothetical protein
VDGGDVDHGLVVVGAGLVVADETPVFDQPPEAAFSGHTGPLPPPPVLADGVDSATPAAGRCGCPVTFTGCPPTGHRSHIDQVVLVELLGDGNAAMFRTSEYSPVSVSLAEVNVSLRMIIANGRTERIPHVEVSAHSAR